MPTRIKLRTDTDSGWSAAVGNGFGNLDKGEVGVSLLLKDNGDTQVSGFLGVADGQPITSGALVFSGLAIGSQLSGESFAPVIYETQQEIAEHSVLSWDASASEWVVTEEVLSLDALPTSSGTVVWNQAAQQFEVGNVLPANDIEGGSY